MYGNLRLYSVYSVVERAGFMEENRADAMHTVNVAYGVVLQLIKVRRCLLKVLCFEIISFSRDWLSLFENNQTFVAMCLVCIFTFKILKTCLVHAYYTSKFRKYISFMCDCTLAGHKNAKKVRILDFIRLKN